jgi:beta-galactosidase/beta-glucuronidase
LKPWKDLNLSAEGKAFSGTVTYTTKFTAEKSGKVMLDLGKVDMIAKVKLNGKTLRTLWCAPYSLDISDAVIEGENELEIEVTSTWFNRLVYDASLPESERKTWTLEGPKADNALRESGLMGPVKLVYGK